MDVGNGTPSPSLSRGFFIFNPFLINILKITVDKKYFYLIAPLVAPKLMARLYHFIVPQRRRDRGRHRGSNV
jgi:hypothetical protein